MAAAASIAHRGEKRRIVVAAWQQALASAA